MCMRGELNNIYPVMKIEHSTNIMYFLVVEDPSNAVYSTWLKHVSGTRLSELGTTNDEMLADIVETTLGCCYLATTFPNHLLKYISRPNEIWSRIEITQRKALRDAGTKEICWAMIVEKSNKHLCP